MQLTPSFHADDLFLLGNKIPIITRNTGIRVYDYHFRTHFDCKTLIDLPDEKIIARAGALPDYEALYLDLQSEGFQLIHSPEEHNRCSMLPVWYPFIADITPASFVFDELPSAEEVERMLGWPVFIKGERQTSRHSASLSVARNKAEFEDILANWSHDPILKWQRMVCRKFVPLHPVAGGQPGKLPPSCEFRVFFWQRRLMTFGRYWHEAEAYTIGGNDTTSMLGVAQQAADRINVAFLAVDVAKTLTGEWIVIEVNDGQESGYAGADAGTLWRNILIHQP